MQLVPLEYIGIYGGWPFAVCTNPDTLSIEPDEWDTCLFFLPGGLPPAEPPARADGRGTHFLHIVFFRLLKSPYSAHCFCFFTFGGVYKPREARHPVVFVTKFHIECIQNHVLGPLGGRVMSIFVNTCISVEVELGDSNG